MALTLLTAALFLLLALSRFAGRLRILTGAMATTALYGFSGYMFNPAQQHRLIECRGLHPASSCRCSFTSFT